MIAWAIVPTEKKNGKKNSPNFVSSSWNVRMCGTLNAKSEFDIISLPHFYNIIRAHHKIAVNHMLGVYELKSFYVLFPSRKRPLSACSSHHQFSSVQSMDNLFFFSSFVLPLFPGLSIHIFYYIIFIVVEWKLFKNFFFCSFFACLSLAHWRACKEITMA